MTDISDELAKELKSAILEYAAKKKRFVDAQANTQEAFNALVKAEADLQPILSKLSKELD